MKHSVTAFAAVLLSAVAVAQGTAPSTERQLVRYRCELLLLL